MTTTQQKIIEIIAEILGISEDDIDLPSKLEQDLGMDSLDSAEVINALEYDFTVSISDGEWERLRTVEDVYEMLKEKGVPE